MKRIGVIIVLVALFFNTVGFYLYYCAAMYSIHTHWRAKLNNLPDEKLTCLTLGLDVYRNAIVEEDELEIDGHMFDVVHAKIVVGGQVRVYGAFDKDEDNLMAQLKECFDQPGDLEDFCNTITGFLTLVYVVPAQPELSGTVLTRSSFISFYRLSLYEVHRSICLPPPDARLGEIFQS